MISLSVRKSLGRSERASTAAKLSEKFDPIVVARFSLEEPAKVTWAEMFRGWQMSRHPLPWHPSSLCLGCSA